MLGRQPNTNVSAGLNQVKHVAGVARSSMGSVKYDHQYPTLASRPTSIMEHNIYVDAKRETMLIWRTSPKTHVEELQTGNCSY